MMGRGVPNTVASVQDIAAGISQLAIDGTWKMHNVHIRKYCTQSGACTKEMPADHGHMVHLYTWVFRRSISLGCIKIMLMISSTAQMAMRDKQKQQQ
jgi:hypothetical protein